MNGQALPALVLVDDDQDDRYLFEKALKENGFSNKAVFLSDGMELMEYLGARSRPSQEPLEPQVILLDLNMPRLDGREALKLIKGDEALRQLPVVILTTSQNPEDVQAAYQLGANSFFSKPMDYPGLVRLFGVLKDYWMGMVVLPS